MNRFKRLSSFTCIALLSAAYQLLAGEGVPKGTPPAWQNPDIGLNLDATIELNDVNNEIITPGLNIRGAELIISSHIDPYASLTGNLLVSEHGMELHEAFVTFPYLPLSLSAKAGLMLARFGRWNQFHLHSLPFATEPRIYHEYADGMLALKGIELSSLLPFSHYIELSFAIYDGIRGHTHDADPVVADDGVSHKSLDEIASEMGATQHGSHWHGSSGEILYEADLLAWEKEQSSLEPTTFSLPKDISALAYGGKVSTAFEFGANISLDAGFSVLYQKKALSSKRVIGHTYSRFLYGTDLTLFWHPLTRNKYRNLQAGVELIGSYSGMEFMSGGEVIEYYGNRAGLFYWLSAQLTTRWQTGLFSDIFQPLILNDIINSRTGAFVTCNISHYQYLRIEFSRYNYANESLSGVNRLILQYNATIGHHTHGRQR